ncbi:glycoside hydrolase family 2 TIM barrel-domain containing protein [Agromyces atrinae]|uniref:Beta-galactosidase n=1 Tax=Agromyces atrinae TaxID=592376 RepID=A0A4Q2MA27_9MICO|nr:glycoside hydrolase family 2 TIM barrel-domain containing protein [Agromyces atrinae]NYD67526.1 beta-galactosidase [Agromyces atrinae]RXZ88257.1 DUF4981 domain-containing protein [Agromyces atrinae]
MTNYWESTAPGAGRRAPRADALSNARRLDLGGTWRFRLAPTAAGAGDGAEISSPGFDDSAWDALRVPAHWVLEDVTPLAGGPARSLRGSDEGPLYTNTALPIPIDPPRVPTENPTGDHRLVFDVPADFGPAVLRFQGVDSAAKVWLNGRELGYATGSRLPFEFDAPVVAGENVLLVRVHRWSSGTYVEDQDMWWLPGIFRDVELLERPAGSIDDHHVVADYDHVTGEGTLTVTADVAATVRVPELGIEMPAGSTAVIPVEPWSAEQPRLYRGTLESAGEIVELSIGFRTVAIVDGVLTVNGRKVFFRGVNRHEHDPDTGRTLSRETMIRDIRMMKQANVNAVRTSHYPPHPEFLRLCDEYGLWVVEEGDLETHGFIYAGWEGNPPATPEWSDALLDRTRRMVERDKNRPSVVVWSLANESWTGDAFGELERWIRDRDPSRPIHYERDPSYKNSDFASLMYPTQELLEQIGQRDDPRPEGVTDDEDARRRTLPFLLCEYAHAMGNGPGSLADYQRILERYDRFCGAFVWEWIDHGFRAHTDDGREFFMHGGDVAYRPNGGRYCLDGLVFSDRSPSPGLAELKKALEPVSIVVGDDIEITNKQHVAGLEAFAFDWVAEVSGEEVARGVLDVPAVAAGESVRVAVPAVSVPAVSVPAVSGGVAGSAGLAVSAGEVWLTVVARLAAETSWADAGHEVTFGQGVIAGSRVAASVAPRIGAARSGDRITLGAAEFDAESGRLVSLGGVAVDGPEVDLYRAPTENDRGQGSNNNVAAVWQAVGLERMQHRTDSVEFGDFGVRVTGRSAPATHPHGVRYTFDWSASADEVSLTTTVEFVGPWTETPYMQRDILPPRMGLRLALPGAYREVDWLGFGPEESYVDSRDAARFGRFAASIDGLQTPYPVPQENGNHVGTRTLALAGDGLPTLTVDGDEFDFTVRRWTSQDLERARRPIDLRDSGRVWLNLDARQQGLGSASCGPALPDRYRVPRETTSWTLRFRV